MQFYLQNFLSANIDLCAIEMPGHHWHGIPVLQYRFEMSCMITRALAGCLELIHHAGVRSHGRLT